METHQEVRDWGKMHVYSTLQPQNAEQKQNVWSVKPSEHEHRNECASAALWSVFGVAAWHCHIELNLRELYPWSDQKRIHEPLLFCCRNRVLKKPMDGYQRRNSCMKSVCGECNRKSKKRSKNNFTFTLLVFNLLRKLFPFVQLHSLIQKRTVRTLFS